MAPNKKPTKQTITDKDIDKSIPNVYEVIDNDLARDNVENDLTAADLQDL